MKNVLSLISVLFLVGCGQGGFDGGFEISGSQIKLTGTSLDKVQSIEVVRTTSTGAVSRAAFPPAYTPAPIPVPGTVPAASLLPTYTPVPVSVSATSPFPTYTPAPIPVPGSVPASTLTPVVTPIPTQSPVITTLPRYSPAPIPLAATMPITAPAPVHEVPTITSTKTAMDISEQTPVSITAASKDGTVFDDGNPLTVIATTERFSFSINIVLPTKTTPGTASISVTATESVKCASDYTLIGNSAHGYYCISTVLQTAMVWMDAEDSCAKVGTTLCSFGQIYTACKAGTVDPKESVWTNEIADQNNAVVKGGAGCYSLGQYPTYSMSVKFGVRCCYTPNAR